MRKVAEISAELDLTELTNWLWQNQIPHRVIFQNEQQELWLAEEVPAELVLTVLERWQQGESLQQLSTNKQRSGISIFQQLGKAWLSTLLILSSVLITLLISFGDDIPVMRWLTIADLVQQGNQLYTSGIEQTIESFQLWRFFTPAFLHFSGIHLIFNLLWIWIVGTRIEMAHGRWVLLGLVAFSAIVSNIAQYLISGPLFGGMSGVVYALLAYSWLWSRWYPHRSLGLPPALMGFMMFWLVLGYTGMLEALQLGAIANTAHLVGLLSGFAYLFIIKAYLVRN